MMISYKKLWKLLVEKEMTKTDLRIKAGISTGALAKLGKNKSVSMEVLAKICATLVCTPNDIVEFVFKEEAECKECFETIKELVCGTK